MMQSIYKEALCTLLAAVHDYKSQSISLERYQAEIFKTENEIVSIDEKELRSLLQNHENQLELIQYTTGDRTSILVELDKFQKELCLWL
jgi:hypothetical protein